ncbi:ERV/ALR sulfhydryl oxidase domain-containing protein [Crepidotus variabilis]|uniref:Sulfhydryl oxidase n=1 Tax=Crepidotus variabilis TaxID=179855 RepID=A0A9P6JK43_9AGAR|nr:ERV/ALR sulfhydryl oxidase domain-containing protein [Crepidotus variabilis]
MLSRFAKSLIFVIFAMLLLTTIALKHPPARMYIDPWTGQLFGEGGVEKTLNSEENWTPVIGGVKGNVIMGKLGNATAKAELGRATWKLLHTTTLRYPEQPTPDEREALSSYFYLSSRLYPCGECAAEFQQLLKKYPPQTSSRRAASLWLCFIHNEVNQRLKKPEFDCAHLSEKYDCGCGDDKKSEKLGSSPETVDSAGAASFSRDLLTGAGMVRGG